MENLLLLLLKNQPENACLSVQSSWVWKKVKVLVLRLYESISVAKFKDLRKKYGLNIDESGFGLGCFAYQNSDMLFSNYLPHLKSRVSQLFV